MSEPSQVVGKYLIAVGAIIVMVGLLLVIVPKVPLLGKLPGDLHFQRDKIDVFIPVTTSVLLSLLLSLAVWAYQYFMKK